MTTPTASTATPATPSSTAAIVLAVIASLGPVGMIALFLAFGPHVPFSANPNLELFATVLAFFFLAVLSPVLAIVALVLALVNRRRDPGSRRNAGIALTILGTGIALFVLQALLSLL